MFRALRGSDAMKHATKTNRRVGVDRRVKTRAGRRLGDPAPSLHCRTCGSEEIGIVLLSAAERMLQCRKCLYTWFVNKNGK